MDPDIAMMVETAKAANARLDRSLAAIEAELVRQGNGNAEALATVRMMRDSLAAITPKARAVRRRVNQ